MRRDHPHAAYDKVEWDVITTQNGDVFDKAVVRILEIHLEKRGLAPDDFDLDDLATETDGFTGAEIEEAIVSARYLASSTGATPPWESITSNGPCKPAASSLCSNPCRYPRMSGPT